MALLPRLIKHALLTHQSIERTNNQSMKAAAPLVFGTLLLLPAVASFVPSSQRTTTTRTFSRGGVGSTRDLSSSSLQMTPSPIAFLQQATSSWQGILSSALVVGGATAASSSTTTTLAGWATQLQSIGETALAALLVIAAVQGVFITKQYETNPLGELIVPPGITMGVEDASRAMPSKNDDKNDSNNNKTLSNEELEILLCTPSDTQFTCATKKSWFKFLNLLLLPMLMAGQGAVLQCGHLLHLSCIMGLAHLWDGFKQLPAPQQEYTVVKEEAAPFDSDNPHVLVLGDSMAVGIGCVDAFDPNKNSGILYRIEQLEESHNEKDTGTSSVCESSGPLFPRALARTLSQRLGKPVSWRSAGVDGGDTLAIQKHLLPIVQEEVDNGNAPDVVVVLTGSNDLKRILSPQDRASVRGFLSNLMELSMKIRAISPKTKVVFPALPTYRLDQYSILNVFPLSLFLDGIIGLWDSQKIQAAKQSDGVVYVDLTASQVRSWYHKVRLDHGGKQPTLIAADGIHPNAQCYAIWYVIFCTEVSLVLCNLTLPLFSSFLDILHTYC